MCQVAGVAQQYGDPTGYNGSGARKLNHGTLPPNEFLPILLACAVWGREWSGKLIHYHCDNMAVVEVINSRDSRDKELMHLLRCLFS